LQLVKNLLKVVEIKEQEVGIKKELEFFFEIRVELSN
jgi:putative transposon-encoded protein